MNREADLINQLLDCLRDEDKEHTVYIAGGWVRDNIYDKPIGDVDIVLIEREQGMSDGSLQRFIIRQCDGIGIQADVKLLTTEYPKISGNIPLTVLEIESDEFEYKVNILYYKLQEDAYTGDPILYILDSFPYSICQCAINCYNHELVTTEAFDNNRAEYPAGMVVVPDVDRSDDNYARELKYIKKLNSKYIAKRSIGNRCWLQGEVE